MIADAGQPLGPLFERFRAKKLPFADPQTVYQYSLNLRRFGEFLEHEPTTLDLRDELVTSCMAWLCRTKGLSPTSANKLRDNFNAFWGFLARQKIVDVWPEIAEMPEPEKIVVAWSRDQLHRLWNALARQPGTWDDCPCSLWWVSLHGVLWDTAGRIGAVRQLRWTDVDFGEGCVTMHPETMKGKRRGRVLYVHPQTIHLLRLMRDLKPREPKDLVWLFPYKRQEYIYTLYRTILQDAALPVGRDRAFHCVRKSSSSFYDAAGGDASKLLGHASRDVTERHYLDQKIANRMNASALLFRPGSAEPPAA